MTDELVEMPLTDILRGWRPGSQEWSWEEEQKDLFSRDAERTEALRQAILREGFGLADTPEKAIKLGNDGRVWNGHHRLCLAMVYRPETLMVLVVGPEETEHQNTNKENER